MKRIFTTLALTIGIALSAFAQANKVAVKPATVSPAAKQAAPEGHYCSYCKMNYPESHFPCIMKAIKGKVDADGKVSFSPGGPIGGIVVKGGKNPGGNLRTVTTENGEVEINNLTAGNYKFTFALPTHDPQARVAGTPIGGIIVKGGKNPGGQMFTVVTNANGEIILNNLEAGNYKFVVMSPTQKVLPLL